MHWTKEFMAEDLCDEDDSSVILIYMNRDKSHFSGFPAVFRGFKTVALRLPL